MIIRYDGTENGFCLQASIPQGFEGIVELEDVHGTFALTNGSETKTVCAEGKLCIQLAPGMWELRKNAV